MCTSLLVWYGDSLKFSTSSKCRKLFRNRDFLHLGVCTLLFLGETSVGPRCIWALLVHLRIVHMFGGFLCLRCYQYIWEVITMSRKLSAFSGFFNASGWLTVHLVTQYVFGAMSVSEGASEGPSYCSKPLIDPLVSFAICP